MFIIEKNYVVKINSDDLQKTLKEIDDCIYDFIIIPPIYHIKTSSGKKINGFTYFLFNSDKNIFLKNGYTFYQKNQNNDIVSKLKSLNLNQCLLWFLINHKNTLKEDFGKIYKIVSQKCKNMIKKYDLQNKKLNYIIKHLLPYNEKLMIEFYDILYDLIVISDVISTKYIKII